MKFLEISVNGKAYPCGLTMGAMLRFKEHTGHEVTAFDGSVADMCAFIWCCTAGACNRRGVPFDISFMDFCDGVDPTEIRKIWDNVQPELSGDGEEAQDEEKKS